MHAKLLVEIEPGRELAIDLPDEGVILGRETPLLALRSHCASDRKISGKHCHLLRQEGRWLLEDLRSTNGTYVNELLVQKKLLEHLEVIRIGSLAMRFCTLGAPSQQAPPNVPALPIPDPEETTRLARELAVVTTRYTALADEAQKLQQQLQAERSENSALEKKNQELLTELLNEHGAATQVAQLRIEQQQAQTTIETLSEQVRTLEAARREGQLAAQRLQSMSQKSERAVAERDQAVVRQMQLRDEAAQLRQAVGEREQLVQQLKEGLHNHSQKLAELGQQLEQQQQRGFAVRAERDNLQKRLDDLQINIQTLEVSNQALRQENQSLAAAVSAQRAYPVELANCTQQVDALTAANQQQRSSHQHVVAVVQQVCQASQLPLAELRLQVASAQAALARFETQRSETALTQELRHALGSASQSADLVRAEFYRLRPVLESDA